jgi:diguanylate cyclase (GGDEF)-like protein
MVERARILVADDSRVIRKAVEKILGADFALTEAEDGEAAWNALANGAAFDMLMTDIDMPKVDGYSLLCRVRAAENPTVRDLPVLVLTGAEDETTRERAFACGATDFITKPIDAVQLLARARAHTKADDAARKLSETEVALEEQSANDALTGLQSRRYFLQQGAQSLAYAKRHGMELSLVRIDIDGFRALYDTHGDEISNTLLAWMAKVITANLRTEDTAARLKGAQFGILAPAAGRMEAAIVCERIRNAATTSPFVHANVSIPITISLGLATLGRDPGDDIDALLRSAEQALTLAKAGGGNRLGVSYHEEIAAPEEAVMEQPDLERALQLLAGHESGKLLPYLPDLLLRILPLLEHGNRQLDLGLSFDLESLKERLNELK